MHKNKRKFSSGNTQSTGGAMQESGGESSVLDTMKQTFAGIENLGAIGERATAIGESVEGQIHARPFAAIGIGVAFGVGVGFLLRRGLFGALLVAGAGLLMRRFVSELDLGQGFAGGSSSDEEMSASDEDDQRGRGKQQDDNDDELVDDEIAGEPARDKSERITS